MSCKFGLASCRSKFIHSEVRFRASAPKALRRFAQLLKYRQGVELAVTFVHENEERTDGLGSQAATFGGLGEKRTLSTSRSPSQISIASTVGNRSA